MAFPVWAIVVIVLLVMVPVIIYGIYFGVKMMQGASLPDMHPEAFLKKVAKEGRGTSPVVVLVGDSHTHGRMGVSWAPLVARQRPDLQIVNAGINGEQTKDVLKRIKPILACDPDFAVVILGSNERLASVGAGSGLCYGQCMAPAQQNAYARNLRTLLDSLLTTRVKHITFMCPPPAEVPTDAPLNVLGAEFKEILRDFATEAAAAHPGKVSYVPLSDRFDSFITAERFANELPTVQWTQANFVPLVMTAQYKRWLKEESYDEISRERMLKFTVDCIHLNTAGASIVAETVCDSLALVAPPSAELRAAIAEAASQSLQAFENDDVASDTTRASAGKVKGAKGKGKGAGEDVELAVLTQGTASSSEASVGHVTAVEASASAAPVVAAIAVTSSSSPAAAAEAAAEAETEASGEVAAPEGGAGGAAAGCTPSSPKDSNDKESPVAAAAAAAEEEHDAGDASVSVAAPEADSAAAPGAEQAVSGAGSAGSVSRSRRSSASEKTIPGKLEQGDNRDIV